MLGLRYCVIWKNDSRCKREGYTSGLARSHGDAQDLTIFFEIQLTDLTTDISVIMIDVPAGSYNLINVRGNGDFNWPLEFDEMNILNLYEEQQRLFGILRSWN
eukprot:TRINITY_DN1590_c0_g1_i1.p2 TRINITY_DN1590_c0_g1~~TRINITY_DN1590_c0_g1_i1.p2  ORF type:complete len:103 (+),score=15.61 TRINITY_DN1590_c0_g1_i1:751-1059(+)